MSSKQFYEKYIKEELEKKISANKIRGSNQGILHQSEHGFQIAVFGCALGRLYYHANKINKEFNLIFKADGSLVITKCEYSISPLSLSVVNEEKKQWKALSFNAHICGFPSRSGFSLETKRDPNLLLIDSGTIYK